MTQADIDLHRPPGDRVVKTTCYMCACRCGIDVHLNGDELRYIEGNRDHPVNRGVICAKGAAGLMQHRSPARLRSPMRRTGPRGSGRFEPVSWDEALASATKWLGEVRQSHPQKLAFFTGRDQSQSLTGYWAMQFGTPNFAAHGGFCSVNMAAGGLYTLGGSFWEFGETDWERTRYCMMFGVAEDHASNPIKIGIGTLKARGGKLVSINPVRTGYSAVADEWVGIRPGTDGLFVGALIHELLRMRRIDVDYLTRYTNAPWLVIDDAGAPDDGLFARSPDGQPLVFARHLRQLSSALPENGKEGIPPEMAALSGTFRLADGRRARPVFELLARRFLDTSFSPHHVAGRTGIATETIERIARELAHAAFEGQIVLDQPWTDWRGIRHTQMTGRPVSFHAMRGISAHSNGFHTCRMIHILQILLGSVDCPGGFRFSPPCPLPTPPAVRPHGAGQRVRANTPLDGPNLGFPVSPEDLLLDGDAPARIDKSFSWEAPLAAHGRMHMVIENAARGDPYPIDVLFMYMANMAWNSSMDVKRTLECLTARKGDGYAIPKIIYCDAYYSEMVPYADLILPDTTYLERWDCISLLDRPISDPTRAADAIRQPVVRPDRDVRPFQPDRDVRPFQPDRDVRPFQDVLIDLGARLGLPGFVRDDGSPLYPGGYPDYMVNHERKPGIGPLAGWRGADGTQNGRGAPNPHQLERYIENGAFFEAPLSAEQAYFKHANRAWLDWAVKMGLRDAPQPTIFQLYCEPLQKFRLAARGHGALQPPENYRRQIDTHFDPLPFWHDATDAVPERDGARDEYPLHAITQRPMHIYHSWGGQNAWLRQITSANRLYIHTSLADKTGVAEDDWVWLISPRGRVRCQIQPMNGVNPQTVWTWNAIGKRRGAWGLDDDAPESQSGFLLNHLIALLLPGRDGRPARAGCDPVTGQAAWYDLRVRIEKAGKGGGTQPLFEPAGPGARLRGI